MAKSTGVDDAELRALVSSQIRDARSYEGTDRAHHREWALRFFNGEIDIPKMGDDRSSFVSRDVADTHGLILPGLLRVFFASDRIVIYEPTRAEHKAYADQATDLVNFIVMKECDGYRQFRDTISDALLLGNGIMKHWWDKTPIYETEDYTGLSDAEYAFVTNKPDVEIVKHKEHEDTDWQRPAPPPDLMQAAMAGDPQAIAMVGEIEAMTAPMLHDFTVKRIKSKGRLRIAAVPDEEFLIERTAKVLDENVRFCAHVQRVTRSDLIKEGYPREKVDAIPTFARDIEEETARDARDRLGYTSDNAPDKSTEYVERHECYVLMDHNDDGIAERRRIVMAGSGDGGVILANDEWGDDLPFSDIVPDPRAHSWKGQDLYDEVGDVQRIKSMGMRAILDNMYEILNPQRDVVNGAYLNMDAVVDRSLGAVLIRKDAQSPPLQDYIPQSIAPQVFPVLEYFDGVVEKRTGISQRSSALDMDALQNQTATAVNAVQAATQSKIEEYARNIAECGGMKRVFQCILRLIVKHQDDAKTIRLRGDLVDVDTSGWDASMDVTVNVGLGTGSRDKDLAMLQGIAAKQEQVIAQFGPFNEDFNIGHLMDTYQKMAEAAGVKNADSFFPSISQERVAEIREQQAKASAEQGQQNPMLQAEQMKIDLQRQRDQDKLAFERERAALKIQQDQERAQFDMALKAQSQQADMAHKEQVAVLDAGLKRMEMMLEMRLTQEANAMKLRTNPTADTNLAGQSV